MKNSAKEFFESDEQWGKTDYPDNMFGKDEMIEFAEEYAEKVINDIKETKPD